MIFNFNILCVLIDLLPSNSRWIKSAIIAAPLSRANTIKLIHPHNLKVLKFWKMDSNASLIFDTQIYLFDLAVLSSIVSSMEGCLLYKGCGKALILGRLSRRTDSLSWNTGLSRECSILDPLAWPKRSPAHSSPALRSGDSWLIIFSLLCCLGKWILSR